MTSAKTFFTVTIHAPARGNRASEPLESPTITRSVDIPSENVSRYRKPSATLFVTVTQVSTAAITGAEQGAATSPDIAPIANAPENRPPVPADDARSSRAAGTGTGITSSIARAAITSRFAMAKYSHGLVLTVPNNVPVRPAKSPRAE